ncbi:putative thioredoxin [Nocardioides sp. PD653]|nr:Putative thioredoxin [Nocardioides sp. PD653-B2]GAW57601.1 putative thioredoxin [Nocardioides sp. PD653]
MVVAVVAALAFGGYRLLTDGRFRGTHRLPVEQRTPAEGLSVSTPAEPTSDLWSHVVAAVPEATLGDKATLLQFSSAFCAPCRVTRRTLSEVAELVPGVEHLEVDAEHHLDLVRRLGILRTPTTLVLDASGREVTRAAGAPRKEQVLSALGSA